MERERFTTNLLGEVKVLLKILAAREKIPANELLERLIMEYDEKQKKSQ